jgi:hypothetical protein
MSYIDVLIPGAIGVVLVAAPQLFTKGKGEDSGKVQRKLRTIGIVLIGVATLYFFLTIPK